MDIFVYILKITFHFIFALVMIRLSKRDCRANLRACDGMDGFVHKLSAKTILLFCIFEAIYTLICAPFGVYLADRRIYALHFTIYDNDASTLGLAVVSDILWLFSNKPEYLFVAIAVLYILVTCIAYNKYEDANPTIFLLIGLSLYTTYGLYQFKQCMAAAFTALSFAYFFRNKKIPCICSLTVAILFHETALLMIPLMILLKIVKSKVGYFVASIILLSCLVFFEPANRLVIGVFAGFIPSFSARFGDYLSSSGSLLIEPNYVTALKGIPYYFIVLIGLIKRPYYHDRIKNYDKLLFISVFVSVTTMASIYMYWLWRIGELAYMVVFYFWSQLCVCFCKKEYKQLNVLLGGTFFLLTLYQLIICYINYGGII